MSTSALASWGAVRPADVRRRRAAARPPDAIRDSESGASEDSDVFPVRGHLPVKQIML
jgi:hypothetical protein